MELSVYKARIYLYWIFLFWTILLFALTVARLSYTEHLPTGDPLNGGVNFFDPSVVALLFSSLLSLVFTPFMLYTFYTQYIHPFLTIVVFELSVAVVIWVIWLASTAAATSVWPSLSFCIQYRACTNLQAMIAFAYLGWISLTFIILITIVFTLRGKALYEQNHGPWADKLVFGSISQIPRMSSSEFGGHVPPEPQMRTAEAV